MTRKMSKTSTVLLALTGLASALAMFSSNLSNVSKTLRTGENFIEMSALIQSAAR